MTGRTMTGHMLGCYRSKEPLKCLGGSALKRFVCQRSCWREEKWLVGATFSGFSLRSALGTSKVTNLASKYHVVPIETLLNQALPFICVTFGSLWTPV